MSNRIGLVLALLLIVLGAPVYARWCGVPGQDGSATPSGIINTYYRVSVSAASGATSIALGASRGASAAINPGDLLLVIQAHDAEVNTTNDSSYGDGIAGGLGQGTSNFKSAGRYEFVRATNSVPTTGGTLTLVGANGGGLTRSYFYNPPSDTGYRQTFQVIRVPQYDEATISGTVTAASWNGATGGVVVMDVARRLTFSGGTITASALGFRGGGGRVLTGGTGSNADYATSASNGANGSKGEGIVGTPRFINLQGTLIDIGVEGIPGGSYGRGAPGNAGGGGTDGNPALNEQNSGGGGGGNAGGGGHGGHAWCSTGPAGCPQSGGHPGAAVSQVGINRLIMGGGGGAGTNNNNTGSPANGLASSGAPGGGVVIVRAGEIAGIGSISADGGSANSTVTTDASGGGGGGGSILIAAVRTVAGTSISASANGGNGGTNSGGGTAHGPGGGGGGGFIGSTFAISTSVAGGFAGATQNGGTFGPEYGATAGNGGAGTTITGASIYGMSSGGQCTPTVSKAFGTSPVLPGNRSRMNITVTNNNPDLALTSLAFTDPYPAQLLNTASPSPANSCANPATLNAAPNGTSFAVSAGSIDAAASCTFSVNVTPTTSGNKTNVLAAGSLTGIYGGYSVSSLAPASAVLQVSAPLTVTKTSAAYFDQQNGLTNPKLIPGGYVAYTVTVSNPGNASVDSNSIIIVDATPANLRLYVANIPGYTGPVRFLDGSPVSGLTYTFSALNSTTDDVDFSNDGGATWTYVPVADAAGVDPAATHMRIRPKGSMAAGSNFNVSFGYLIN
jgi:uncharacterized repeat protein (TIGR01451 family)